MMEEKVSAAIAHDAILKIKKEKTLSPTFFMSTIHQLESALAASTSKPLMEVDSTLYSVLKASSTVAPFEVVERVTSSSLSEPISAAFILGQLSFAQQFTSDAIARREASALMLTIKEPRFSTYISALQEKAMSGVELAEYCEQRPETVSRNLSELRNAGITDFRREGTRLVNYLTPLGRSLVSKHCPAAPEKSLVSKSKVVEGFLRDISPKRRGMPLLKKYG